MKPNWICDDEEILEQHKDWAFVGNTKDLNRYYIHGCTTFSITDGTQCTDCGSMIPTRILHLVSVRK